MRDVFETSERKDTLKLSIPVTVRVEKVYDQMNPDDSFLGKLVDDCPYKGAIRIENPDRRHHRGAEYVYYTNEGLRGTIESNAKDLRERYGRSRHAAWTEARGYDAADLKRLLAYYRNDWWFIGLVVTVTCLGITASHSLWGVESDADQKYYDEIERDCFLEAVAEIKAKITKLVEGAAEVLAE